MHLSKNNIEFTAPGSVYRLLYLEGSQVAQALAASSLSQTINGDSEELVISLQGFDTIPTVNYMYLPTCDQQDVR